MEKKKHSFLPMSKEDLESRGWKELDIIIVTGDAYVDHPSYGAAVIGRTLEHNGYKVGIISQPDWKSAEEFKKLGRPRLFFGITSGNVDSMVANYTSNKKPRATDDYAPGGKAGKRPDRALIAYSNRAREAFPGVTVVLGGIEASLRRFAHYDFWDDVVRRSVLLDAKADMIVYGMGEKAIVEIAGRLDAGEKIGEINGTRGTLVARKEASFLKEYLEIPSYEEARDNKDKFNEAFKGIYFQQNPVTSKPVAQKHGDRYVIQFPPAMPLSERELDDVYELPYAYAWHPRYVKDGGVKALETVRFSITSHRGCSAECSFCGIHMHQGRIVQSRSSESILMEAKKITERPDFRGTISDIGGPTANMYASRCRLWATQGACEKKSCLVPEKCPNFILGYDVCMRLYDGVKMLPRVKHVFIASGLRYDLLNDKYSDKYLEKICREHISGQMKVAPEHTSDKVLALMNKPPHKAYERFVQRIEEINKCSDSKTYLVNYFVSAHPGATLRDALETAVYLAKRRMSPEQVQDFIPLPMTLSAAIYHTGKHPFTGEKVYVPDSSQERKMQRALIQSRNPSNEKYVEEALRILKAWNLKDLLLGDNKIPVHKKSTRNFAGRSGPDVNLRTEKSGSGRTSRDHDTRRPLRSKGRKDFNGRVVRRKRPR